MESFYYGFQSDEYSAASHDFIHAKITNCSVSIELMFSAALAHNVEIFIIGKRQVLFTLIRRRKFKKIIF